jgi:hypothetical protein
VLTIVTVTKQGTEEYLFTCDTTKIAASVFRLALPLFYPEDGGKKYR